MEDETSKGTPIQEIIERTERMTTLPLYGKAGSHFVHPDSWLHPDPDKEIWDSLIRPVHRLRHLLRRLR